MSQQDPLDNTSNQQQAQQGLIYPGQQQPTSTMVNSSNTAPGAAPASGSTSSMMSSLFGLAPNAIAGLLPPNNNDQQQQPQQNQLQQPNPQQQQALDLTSEIKRLQQIHQMSTAGQTPNALLMTGQQQSQQASQQAALMQSLFAAGAGAGADGKGNNANTTNQQALFDEALRQGAAAAAAAAAANSGTTATGTSSAPFNPVFQPGLLQDARLLMAQNHFGVGLTPLMAQQANAAVAGAATGAGTGAGEVPLPSPHSLFHRDGTRRMRGGVIEPFPEKLHRLLTECELANRSDVISWVANGRAFCIHKPDKFFKEIVPLYFRQSRLSSFKRQLNLYGFELINSGPSRGGYFHELFVKEHPEMCRRMRRVAVKVSSSMKANAAAKKEDHHPASSPSSKDASAPAAASAAPTDDVKVEGSGTSSSQALADNVRAFLPGADGGNINVADLLQQHHQQQQQQQQAGNNNNLGGL